MDQLSNLAEGFANAITPINLLWVFVGCMLGTAVGVLPGLGSAMAVALLLPVTFSLDPIGAFIMFAGIYYGGLFGDSTTAILMNTPGNSTAIASTFEGHRMAKRGRGAAGIGHRGHRRVYRRSDGHHPGGLLRTGAGRPGDRLRADRVLRAGHRGLHRDRRRGGRFRGQGSCRRWPSGWRWRWSASTASVAPPATPSGSPALFDGIDIIVITVGLLALGEVLHVASRIHKDPTATTMGMDKRPFLSRGEFREALPAWLRGSAFGVPFGAIPAGGAEIPTFLAFGLERRLDRRRKDPQFGKGAIRGLAAPESAANATAGSAMGSLLALGLPTSATAAIMLAAFQQYGMQPGPLLFTRNSDLVWALLASLFIGMFVLLIINLPFAPLWAKLLLIPKPYLYAGITVFAALGVYAGSSSLDRPDPAGADRTARIRPASLRAFRWPRC